MSALDPFISNPASSVPSEYAGAASVDSNSPPSPCESALAQLLELADCSGSNLARANLAAGAVDRSSAPAVFWVEPDIAELLAYANGRRFYAAPDECDSPPLFLSNPSFEYIDSVRERGGVA